MKSILLIGYMCVGKTSVGRALAKRLALPFYDLDKYIEDRYRCKVEDVFREKGEEGFRELEHRMLQEVAAFENVVVACGGGTPCFFDNMDYMRQNGTTLYMKAKPETIVAHLQISHRKRPLLDGLQGEALLRHIRTYIAEREPFYARSEYTINVDVLDDFSKINRLTEDIVQLLGLSTDC